MSTQRPYPRQDNRASSIWGAPNTQSATSPRTDDVPIVTQPYDPGMSTAPPQDLIDADLELIEAARATVDSNHDDEDEQGGIHTMGAAVRTGDGQVVVGINLYHFTGGPCAELVALAAARANGAHTITTIVAVGNNGRGVVGPCGRDRQILFDYYPRIRVLLPTDVGVRATPIEALMPLAATWTTASGTQPPDPARFAD